MKRQAATWIGIYLLLVLAPLLAVRVGHAPEHRGFWVEFSMALGFIGLAMMVAQFALTARFRWIARPYGLDTMMHFHRWAGIIATAFVLAHPVIAIAANPQYLSFFDPRVNWQRAGALSVVTISLLLVAILPLVRQRIGLSYELWRLTHGLLAGVVVLIGLAHVIMVGDTGGYTGEWWKKGIWIVLVGGALVLLAKARVIKPIMMQRRPWRVVNVQPERDRVWTLAIEPDGHGGFTHDPGQFIWLTLRDSPFTMQQHPFTISSSPAAAPRIELTIKELGDFTSTIGRTTPGTRAFVEGPYGTFTLDAAGSAELVFIAGGIGITPMMSMLRAMRDRGDDRNVTLIYGSGGHDKIIFRDELAELEASLNLNVVHVLEEPPDDWTGERGLITPEILDRHMPADLKSLPHYFVCGPEPMMDMVEGHLSNRDVPLSRVHSERFSIV